MATDWRRALLLLRDSFDGRYGDLVVLAPWLPVTDEVAAEQTLESLDADAGIRLRAERGGQGGDAGLLAEILSALLAAARRAGGVGARGPFGDGRSDAADRGAASLPGVRRRVTTVFVQDTDAVVQLRALAGPELRSAAPAPSPTPRVLDRVGALRRARADLSLLKGKQLMTRYGGVARNPREFHDTSYLASEVVPIRAWWSAGSLRSRARRGHCGSSTAAGSSRARASPARWPRPPGPRPRRQESPST